MNFDTRVYKLLMMVPKGKVTTYKAIADALGTKAFRVVGNVLNGNKDTENIPCYKVVNSDGRIGGYSRGIEEKIRRLNLDGIGVADGKIKKFEKRVHTF